MKYINKKLPLLKVGEEIRYMNQDVSGVHCFESNGLHCSESTLKKLISEGWIEEVKPREWWVLECETPGLLWAGEDIKAQLKKNPNLKFIKVREVIE